MLATFFCISAIALISSSQNYTIRIHINHLAQGSPLSFANTYANKLGQQYRFTRIEYFISHFTIHHSGNDSTLSDTIFLVNGAQSADFEFNAKTGSFPDSLTFWFGVDSIRNHSDPAIYPPGHALSPKLYTMHWDWASGYRFWAVDGVADTGTATFPIEFQYHIAGDRNYLQKGVGQAVTSGDTATFVLNMDYGELIGSNDFRSNTYIHGGFGGPFDAPLDSMLQNVRTGHVLSTGKQLILSGRYSLMQGMSVYPNPAIREIFIKSGLQHIENVRLYNLHGQEESLEIEWFLPGRSGRVDLQSVPAGIYHLQLSGGATGEYHYKIVVQP